MSYIKKYHIGGLESNNTQTAVCDTITIGDTKYISNDKFTTMLRDQFIDWGTFLEIYNGKLTPSAILNQVIKMFNINTKEMTFDHLIPILASIYLQSAQDHILSMVKQFMIYEPMAYSIYALFNTIKHHFETIIEKFIIVRNNYITQHQLLDKLNDWHELTSAWSNDNEIHQYESSSIILLFLNPPTLKKKSTAIIQYKIKNSIDKSILTQLKRLQRAVAQFHYAGFCIKEPHIRLSKLLTFPLKEFVKTIGLLDETIQFPNYSSIDTKLNNIFSNHALSDINITAWPKVNKLLINVDNTNQSKIQSIIWYVNKILALRKSLLCIGREYEIHYQKIAQIIKEANSIVFNELSNI